MKKYFNPGLNKDVEALRSEVVYLDANSCFHQRNTPEGVRLLMARVITKEDHPTIYDQFENLPEIKVQ
jgi:hypothetical protein